MTPPPEDFPILRNFIEVVKQDNCTEEVKNQFVDYVRRNADKGHVVLGCTELPVLYDKCKDRLDGINFYDPVIIVLEKLQAEFADLRRK